MRFQSPPPKEDVLPPTSSSAPEVNPKPIDIDSTVSPKPIDVGDAESGSAENKVDSAAPENPAPDQTDQAEQQIQPDVVKPTVPPDAQPADGSAPEIVDHDKVTTPPPASTSSGEPQHGDTKNGKIYVDGFGWIDAIGDSQGSTAEDMYENGNKIGIMN